MLSRRREQQRPWLPSPDFAWALIVIFPLFFSLLVFVGMTQRFVRYGSTPGLQEMLPHFLATGWLFATVGPVAGCLVLLLVNRGKVTDALRARLFRLLFKAWGVGVPLATVGTIALLAVRAAG